MTTNARLSDEVINMLNSAPSMTMDELENLDTFDWDRLEKAAAADDGDEPTSVKEKIQAFFKENGWDILSVAVDIYWIVQQVFITKKWRYEKHHPVLTFLVTGGTNKEQAKLFCAFGAGVKTMSICAGIGKIIARCIK